MEERQQTRHPDPGKEGVNILKSKYDQIRDSILEQLADRQPMAFSALVRAVEKDLEGEFEGSVPWYVTTVKLDLEARRRIERVPGGRPQKLRLVRSS